MSLAPLGVYVHVPFCRRKCAYCDFNSYAGLDDLFADYVRALAREITSAAQSLTLGPVASIYIGGGTPSLLPSSLLGEILRSCRQTLDIEPEAEVTCEANPGLLEHGYFESLLEVGVNRLSLGVQSFNDEELRLLGRIHGAAEAEEAFLAARSSGLTNISLDLLYGLPGQDAATWQESLDRALDLRPEHLSLYSLTLESGTHLARQVLEGLVQAPDEDVAADLYLQACSRLASAGYLHYEISNWALGAPIADWDQPDLACQHNLLYWRNGTYLGFGAGAHSSHGGRRFWNVSRPDAYVERIMEDVSPIAGSEQIDEMLAMGETMMLGLRLIREGVADSEFLRRFDRSLSSVFGREIADLQQLGLLGRLPERVRLSPEGRLLGNAVFARFLPA